MNSFLAAAVVAIIVGIASLYVLDPYWTQADEAFTSPTSVRLPDHGETHNLVGKNWYSPRER